MQEFRVNCALQVVKSDDNFRCRASTSFGEIEFKKKIEKAEIRVKNDEGVSAALQLPVHRIQRSMQFIATVRSLVCMR